MNAIETAHMELALVFFKNLIAEQSDPESLVSQNLRWSTEIVSRAFLSDRK